MNNNGLFRFAEEGKALEIFTPFTPMSWTNKLFNDEFQLEVNTRLEGACFAVKSNFESIPFLRSDTKFFIKIDGKTYKMCRGEGEQFQCIHSIYDSKVQETFQHIDSEIKVFVPVEGKKSVWKITFTNNGNKDTQIDFFSVFHFNTEGLMSCDAYYDECYQGIYSSGFPYYVKYEEMEEVRGKKNTKYVISSEAAFSYDGNANRFWGCDDYTTMPKAVEEGTCRNKCCEQEEPFSILHHKIILAPGKEKVLYFVCGVTGNKEELNDEYQYLSNVETEYEKTVALWNRRIEKFMVETPDEGLNHLVNYWLKKQLTYFVKSNRGGPLCCVRNQLQDLQGYSLIEPKEAFDYFVRVLRRQHHDGYIKQYYHTNNAPDTKLSLLNHSDAYVWMIMCAVEIIENLGDKNAYQYKVGYADCSVEETVLVHLRKAANYMLSQTGQHGLCLMLDGDWNDPVNGPGRLGKGESTWNSMALVYAINRLNEVDYDAELANACKMLRENIRLHCWNGDRYVAGYDDSGHPYGCRGDEEANLFLNAQTWAIISQVATQEQLPKLVETIEQLKNDYGYTLLNPVFTKYNPTWGRVSLKTAGTTENGSVYNHAVMFKAYADLVRGDVERAVQTIQLTLPTSVQRCPDECIAFPVYYSHYYFGVKGDNYGRASGHYVTGTVAWLLWLIVKKIFGINLTSDGVKMQPNLPISWENATITLQHQENKYKIIKQNGDIQVFVEEEIV